MNSGMGLLIVCVVVWFIYRSWRKSRTSGQEAYEMKDSKENVQITKNIYGAIETFAALGHMWKQNTGWAYSKRDFANINVICTSDRTTLKMQYGGDSIAVVMTGSFPEIKAESDNIITYESSDVHSYDPTNPNALWEAFKRQSPNAELVSITQDGTGTWVFIKFE